MKYLGTDGNVRGEHRCNAVRRNRFPDPAAVVIDMRILCVHNDSGWNAATDDGEFGETLRNGTFTLRTVADFAMRTWGSTPIPQHFLGVACRTDQGDEVWFAPGDEFFLGVGIHWDPCSEAIPDYSDMADKLEYDLTDAPPPVLHYGGSVITWSQAWVFNTSGDIPSIEDIPGLG